MMTAHANVKAADMWAVLISSEAKSPHTFSYPLISDRLVVHHRSANG